MRRYIKLAITFAIALIVATGCYLVLDQSFERVAKTQYQRQLEEEAEKIVRGIEHALNQASQTLIELAEQEVTGCTQKNRRTYLNTIETNVWIARIGVANQAGALVCNDLGIVRGAERFLPPFDKAATKITINLPFNEESAEEVSAPIVLSLNLSTGMRLIAEVKSAMFESEVNQLGALAVKRYEVAFSNGDIWFSSTGSRYERLRSGAFPLVAESASPLFPITARILAPPQAITLAYESLNFPIRIAAIIIAVLAFALSYMVARKWIHFSASDIYDAIENDSITIKCKPVFDLRDGSLRAADILLRWKLPDGTVLTSQSEIYESLNQFDMGNYVNELAIEYAAEQIKPFARFCTQMTFMIRVSMEQLRHLEFTQMLIDSFASASIRPDQLIVLISHRAYDENMLEVQVSIAQLRSKGVKVGLDNFAVGTAGLACLAALDIDVIKIDAFLVTSIGSKPVRIVSSALTRLADNLGLTIYAEGVETDTQISSLVSHGVTMAQGSIFGEEMALPSLKKLLIDHKMAVPPDETKPQKTLKDEDADFEAAMDDEGDNTQIPAAKAGSMDAVKSENPAVKKAS